jgi:hypothetical protein
VDETVTVCSIKLDNGYSVRGESACVNPENYNREIGEKIAYDNAFSCCGSIEMDTVIRVLRLSEEVSEDDRQTPYLD